MIHESWISDQTQISERPSLLETWHDRREAIAILYPWLNFYIFFLLTKKVSPLFPSQKKRRTVNRRGYERESDFDNFSHKIFRNSFLYLSTFLRRKEKIKSFVSTQAEDSESQEEWGLKKKWRHCQSLAKRTQRIPPLVLLLES